VILGTGALTNLHLENEQQLNEWENTIGYDKTGKDPDAKKLSETFVII
jgi:hypothetical protein